MMQKDQQCLRTEHSDYPKWQSGDGKRIAPLQRSTKLQNNRLSIHTGSGCVLVHADAFGRNSNCEVSILMTFPSLMNPGTLNSAPVSTLAGFGDVRRGVPFGPWIRLNHLEGDVGWRSYGDRISVEEHHVNRHVFLEVLPIVVHLASVQFVLLERLLVHENEGTILTVKELRFEFLNVSRFQLVTTLERAIQHSVANQILHFATIKCIAFSWLEKINIDQQVRFAVDLNFESFFQVAGFVGCHS